jgi:hypothetical protein
MRCLSTQDLLAKYKNFGMRGKLCTANTMKLKEAKVERDDWRGWCDGSTKFEDLENSFETRRKEMKEQIYIQRWSKTEYNRSKYFT